MDTSPLPATGEEVAAKGTLSGKSVSFSSKSEGEKEGEEMAEGEKMDTAEGEKVAGRKAEDGEKEGKEGKGETKEEGEGKEGKAEEKEPEPDFEILANPARVLVQQVYPMAVLPI